MSPWCHLHLSNVPEEHCPSLLALTGEPGPALPQGDVLRSGFAVPGLMLLTSQHLSVRLRGTRLAPSESLLDLSDTAQFNTPQQARQMQPVGAAREKVEENRKIAAKYSRGLSPHPCLAAASGRPAHARSVRRGEDRQ
jgi:hypothetical protein